jgi:hypothetical protein
VNSPTIDARAVRTPATITLVGRCGRSRTRQTLAMPQARSVYRSAPAGSLASPRSTTLRGLSRWAAR